MITTPNLIPTPPCFQATLFHHMQVQGNVENFEDNCGDNISWLHSITYHTALVEGWALYAESPLVAETDIYDNNLMQKYGMLKWQVC